MVMCLVNDTVCLRNGFSIIMYKSSGQLFFSLHAAAPLVFPLTLHYQITPFSASTAASE